MGAAAALAGPGVAACSAASNKQPDATPSATKPPGPDPQLADLTAEIELLVRYDATLKAHPALRAGLRPLRADHAVHETQLRKLLKHPPRQPTPRPQIPANPAAALQALRDAERTAAAARTRSCVSAATDRCGLLGSIAASEAVHVELLS